MSCKNIILMGNGFDLAHNLKTSYNNFINYLFNQKKANLTQKHIINRLKIIHTSEQIIPRRESNLFRLNNQETLMFSSSNTFFNSICELINKQNWCDIETLYYKLLVGSSDDNVLKLNEDFNLIKNELEKYLNNIDEPKAINSFQLLFDEVTKTGRTLCLNFNYTNTFEKIYNKKLNIQLLNIHGQLNSTSNPIIFGYSATEIENEELLRKDNNEYLKNIKKYHYNRSPIDRTINSYLNSENELNIYIIGHSCGMPDTNILDQIFSHKSIQSINILYHKDYDNYFDTLVNIRRIMSSKENFDKVETFESSMQCPQHYDTPDTIKQFQQKVIHSLHGYPRKKIAISK